MKHTVLFLILALQYSSFSQPVPEWTSPTSSQGSRARWKILRQSPLETRYFIADSVSFRLMTGPYSTTVAVTIPLVPAEVTEYDRLADYENVADASGDRINDIVFRRHYGSGVDPRYGIRLVNVMTGQDILVLDDAGYSYSLTTFTEDIQGVIDVDNDGLNELVVRREPYPPTPNSSFVYVVYQTNGTSTSVGTGSAEVPNQISLGQNFPNPFNPATHIQYELSRSGVATIEIFDINGGLVRTFTNQHQESGPHTVMWDGKDNVGSTVSTGTYFYRLVVDGSSLAKKMILLK